MRSLLLCYCRDAVIWSFPLEFRASATDHGLIASISIDSGVGYVYFACDGDAPSKHLMAKRKINVGGQEFMAEEIEFEQDSAEKWNTYALHDGTTLKLKAVLADVLRLEGMYAPNGDPMYTVNAQIIVTTNAPENLRKKV